MNSYKLKDISVGMTETFSVKITHEMMQRFLEISGDTNPLHNDEEFARKRGYGGSVVFGMLCASLYSTLAGVYLPGEYCLLHGVDIKFKSPVFIGDVLTVRGTVCDISETFRRVEIKADMKNADGKTVNRAVLQCGVLE